MKQLLESPCINVCELNQDNLCTGCFRSIDEIAEWSQMQQERKLAVLQECRRRENAINTNR